MLGGRWCSGKLSEPRGVPGSKISGPKDMGADTTTIP
jgi:hypothetical protein